MKKKFEVYDNFMQSNLDFNKLHLLGVVESCCMLNAMIEAKNKFNTFVKIKEIK